MLFNNLTVVFATVPYSSVDGVSRVGFSVKEKIKYSFLIEIFDMRDAVRLCY